MRRILAVALLPCLALSAHAQTTPPAWSLSLGARALRFSSFATAQRADGNPEQRVRPKPRVGVEVGLARHLGVWQVGLILGYTGSVAEVHQGPIAFSDDGLTINRYRLAASVGRRLAAVDRGELRLLAVPAVDAWAFDGDTRATIAGDLALALDIPIGGVRLRQSLSLGIGGAPATRESLGPDIELERIATLGYGVALAFGL